MLEATEARAREAPAAAWRAWAAATAAAPASSSTTLDAASLLLQITAFADDELPVPETPAPVLPTTSAISVQHFEFLLVDHPVLSCSPVDQRHRRRTSVEPNELQAEKFVEPSKELQFSFFRLLLGNLEFFNFRLIRIFCFRFHVKCFPVVRSRTRDQRAIGGQLNVQPDQRRQCFQSD